MSSLARLSSTPPEYLVCAPSFAYKCCHVKVRVRIILRALRPLRSSKGFASLIAPALVYKDVGI